MEAPSIGRDVSNVSINFDAMLQFLYVGGNKQTRACAGAPAGHDAGFSTETIYA
jgi:hypothetical protein